MNAIPSANNNHAPILWTAVALALFTAFSYVLIATKILSIGDLQLEQDGGIIIYVGAGCYLLGAFINAVVILFFFNIYQNRPAMEITYKILDRNSL